MEETLSIQVSALIDENRRLRKKSESDELTIAHMKTQYDQFAAEFDKVCAQYDAQITTLKMSYEDQIREMKHDHTRSTTSLTMDRDRTARSNTEITGLLNQAADLIMQGLRARVGNQTPQEVPSNVLKLLDDDRIPQVSVY